MRGLLYSLSLFSLLGAIATYQDSDIPASIIALVIGIILFVAAKRRPLKRKPIINQQSEPAPPEKPKPVSSNDPLPDDPIKCPKCGSTQLQANTKGYGAGKALGGVLLTGGIGLLAGFVGSKKLKITCLRCGHRWKPRKNI